MSFGRLAGTALEFVFDIIMTAIKKNRDFGKNDFIDFVSKECKNNDGGLVLQMVDGIFDVANPEHLEWVELLHDHSIRHINKEEAFSLGFDELSNWSHEDDELVYSEMGVLFNLGKTRKGMFKF